MSNSEVFDSVLWDTPASTGYEVSDDADRPEPSSSGPGYRQDNAESSNEHPKWEGYLDVEVKDPVKELENTKDAYVSYLVVGRVRSVYLRVTSIPKLTSYAAVTVRRRT